MCDLIDPLAHCICYICLVNFARLGDDNVVKSSKVKGPLCLMTCESLFCGKILEVHMVQKDLCLIGADL